MSPRAAWRLEHFGFEAYDYAAGKEDWSASGLPMEGELASVPRAGDIAVGVPTCDRATSIGEVDELLQDGDSDMCIVTTEEGVVIGRLRKGSLGAPDDRRAEEIMEVGPTTIRMNEFLPSLVERLRDANVDDIIVTTPLGELRGVLYRVDAEKLLIDHSHQHHHHH